MLKDLQNDIKYKTDKCIISISLNLNVKHIINKMCERKYSNLSCFTIKLPFCVNEKLNVLKQELGKSKSEIIRNSIETHFEFLKNYNCSFFKTFAELCRYCIISMLTKKEIINDTKINDQSKIIKLNDKSYTVLRKLD